MGEGNRIGASQRLFAHSEARLADAEVGGTAGEAVSRASGANQNDLLQSRSFRAVMWLRVLCACLQSEKVDRRA